MPISNRVCIQVDDGHTDSLFRRRSRVVVPGDKQSSPALAGVFVAGDGLWIPVGRRHISGVPAESKIVVVFKAFGGLCRHAGLSCSVQV